MPRRYGGSRRGSVIGKTIVKEYTWCLCCMPRTGLPGIKYTSMHLLGSKHEFLPFRAGSHLETKLEGGGGVKSGVMGKHQQTPLRIRGGRHLYSESSRA